MSSLFLGNFCHFLLISVFILLYVVEEKGSFAFELKWIHFSCNVKVNI